MKLSISSSITLNYLKCLLCIGVVFIHARYFPDLSVLGPSNRGGWYLIDYQLYTIISTWLSENFLNSTCVPLFFVISGYLYFLNLSEKIVFNEHIKKWKSRLRSLLVPYLICNLAFVLFTVLVAHKSGSQISIGKIASAFWAYEGYGGMPLMGPSWFLRDLMVVCLFAPLIQILLKYTRIMPVVILLAFWFAGVWTPIPGFGIRSFLFFTMGAYIATRKIDIIGFIKPSTLWLLWCAVFAIFYGAYIILGYGWIHKMSIMASFPLWITIANGLYSIFKRECPTSLVTGTFFVYLYHFSIAHRIPVYLTKVFGTSVVSVILCYFMGAIITTSLLLGIYYLMRRFTPKTISVIVGGR